MSANDELNAWFRRLFPVILATAAVVAVAIGMSPFLDDMPLYASLIGLITYGVAAVWVANKTVTLLDVRPPGVLSDAAAWLLVIGFFWLLAMIWVSELTFALFKHGHVTFEEEPEYVGDVIPLFWWHIADIVPFVDLPRTLRWEEPLGYMQGGVGFLVIAFQVVVVLPLFLAVRAWWMHARAR